jgi:YesN/AraC family two-component response regulator
MPDIIISDIVMPNMSGIELCRSIKHDFSVCHIPVVLLTARNDINSNLESLKIGADDYITKPFNSTLLISRCNNIINTRQMLRRKFSERPHDNVDLVANNPLDKRMMEQAMAIITKNYTNPEYSVNDFARDIGMSRTSLFTKWKQLTGETPKSFILNMRLRKSAEMLREHPEISIADISERNGFASAKYFCKCFKDYYKMQPSAYRKGNPQQPDGNDNNDDNNSDNN